MSKTSKITVAAISVLALGTAVLTLGMTAANTAQAAKVVECHTISVPVLVCPKGKDLTTPNHGCKGRMMEKRICK